MVLFSHELVCHAENLDHYLQCQGHSEGLYNQKNDYFYSIFLTTGLSATKSYNKKTTISTISSKLLVCLQPNLV